VACGGVVVAALGLTGQAVPSAGAVVTARATLGSQRAFDDSMLGLNGNNVQAGPRWDDPALGSALAAYGPGTLRYPGGTIGNYWSWRDGWFQPNGPWPGQSDLTTGEIYPRFDNALGPYSAVIRSTGALPVFMLNLLTIDGRVSTTSDNARQRSEQVAFLNAAVAAGLTVERIELGNEFYLAGATGRPNDYALRFPTARSYAEMVNTWTGPIRAAFPGAKIAAVGAEAARGKNSARREGWTASMLDALDDVDALTLHLYVTLNEGETRPPDAILAMAQPAAMSLRNNEVRDIAASGRQAWVTEFGMPDRSATQAYAGTWMHGLFVATLAVTMLQDGSITLLHLHNVVGPALAGSHFNSTTAFGAAGPTTQYLGRSAIGNAVRVIHLGARDATAARRLTVTGAPTMRDGSAGMVGIAFVTPNGRRLVLVNNTADTVSLDVSSILSGAVSWQRWTAASLTTKVTGNDAVRMTSGTATGRVPIGPRSVVLLTR
jgi:hypothetical protein